MDPQQQFKDRYNKFIEGRNQQIVKAQTPPPQKRTPINKFYALGILAGIIIILPITFLFLRQNAYKGERIASSPTEVSNEALESQMRLMWGSYYDSVKDNPKIRANAKKQLIESRLNATALNQPGSSSIVEESTTDPFKIQADVMKKVLTWRNIDYAFVFIDPTSPDYQSNVAKITYSYNLLLKYLSQGKSMQEAYDTAKKDSGFFQPITITRNFLAYKESLDASLSIPLFKYKKGQNTNIISGGGTFIIAHINDSKDTSYSTLNQWYAAQQKN